MGAQIDVKIVLKDPDGRPFMGIGLIWLLRGIDRNRSISAAAREMKLSYPKALRMLKDLEGGLGYPVVTRHKGGSGRGGATLTPLGREFLGRYDAMQARIKRFAANTFRETFERPPGTPTSN